MGVLDTILRYKQQKDAEANADIQAIPQAMMLFQQAKQQQFDNMIKRVTLQAELASKGYEIKNGQLVQNPNLISPADKFLQQGKIADAYNNMLQAGMISGGQNSSAGSAPSLPSAQAIPSTTNQLDATQSQDNGSDTFATGATLNVAGVPTSTTVKSESGLRREIQVKKDETKTIKVAEAEAEREIGANKEATNSLRFVQQYDRSYNELKGKLGSDFDATGLKGYSKRAIAKAQTSLDMLPETKAFQVELQPRANQMARDVEGGKITDQDRKIYADSFANAIQNPSETNVRLVSNQLIGLADKGGDISKNVVAMSQSQNPVMQKIVQEVTGEYPEFKPVKIRNKDTGEEKIVTLKQAREMRGQK